MTISRRKLRASATRAVNTSQKYVGGIRGSTVQQQLTIPTQDGAIRRYGDMKGWECARMFIDSGTCGKTPWKQRDVTREMINFMADNGITDIVYTRLDRAFRSTGDAILTLHECLQHGINLHFCEQNIDPSTPMGRAMASIIAVFAELETDLRLERQLETGETMRAANMKCGINEPYGWDKVASPTRKVRAARRTHDLAIGSDTAFDLVPNWKEQEVLREILRRHEEGQKDALIAKLLNTAGIPTKHGKKWHRNTVFSVRSFARVADPAEWSQKEAA